MTSVLGFPIHVGSLYALLNQVLAAFSAGKSCHVVTLNPEMIMAGQADPAFGDILKQADLVLPDGAGVVWALKRQKIDAQRVPGIEFAEALIAHFAQQGGTVALIGAAPDVNDTAADALVAKYPGLQIAYRHHGFFTDAADKQVVAQACADAQPDLVLVALGVPGQELWIRDYRPLFAKPAIFVGVGGSFDVWSGLKKRAPALFRALNLEWFYRIASEPQRIGRVYQRLPMFVLQILLTPSPKGSP